MYVLEGVTPCIQAMDLRAGDTGMHLSRDLYFAHNYSIKILHLNYYSRQILKEIKEFMPL